MQHGVYRHGERARPSLASVPFPLHFLGRLTLPSFSAGRGKPLVCGYLFFVQYSFHDFAEAVEADAPGDDPPGAGFFHLGGPDGTREGSEAVYSGVGVHVHDAVGGLNAVHAWHFEVHEYEVGSLSLVEQLLVEGDAFFTGKCRVDLCIKRGKIGMYQFLDGFFIVDNQDGFFHGEHLCYYFANKVMDGLIYKSC